MHRVSWSPPTLVIVVTGYFRPCGPAAGLQKVYASETTSSGPPGRAGYLNVRAMIGQSQDYQRKSLFTALMVKLPDSSTNAADGSFWTSWTAS
jgi:hypothetical protein